MYKKNFIKKVIKERIVDTKNYRYTARTDRDNHERIYRIKINLIGTTEALKEENWKYYYTIF